MSLGVGHAFIDAGNQALFGSGGTIDLEGLSRDARHVAAKVRVGRPVKWSSNDRDQSIWMRLDNSVEISAYDTEKGVTFDICVVPDDRTDGVRLAQVEDRTRVAMPLFGTREKAIAYVRRATRFWAEAVRDPTPIARCSSFHAKAGSMPDFMADPARRVANDYGAILTAHLGISEEVLLTIRHASGESPVALLCEDDGVEIELDPQHLRMLAHRLPTATYLRCRQGGGLTLVVEPFTWPTEVVAPLSTIETMRRLSAMEPDAGAKA